MKTILVMTDFSGNAGHAIEYSHHLAVSLAADLLICNAVSDPAESHQVGMVAWPVDEYELLNKESQLELQKIKGALNQQHLALKGTVFIPQISITSVRGTVVSAVQLLCQKRDIQLVVVGSHEKDRLSDFLLGNNVNQLISNIDVPLLIVPPFAPVRKISSISFATALDTIGVDKQTLFQLLDIARPLGAEVLLTHLYHEKNDTLNYQKWAKEYMEDISTWANYSKLRYQLIKSNILENGLDYLCKSGQVDILAMVHQHRNLIDRIFKGSRTQKMAGQIHLPLLVLPCHSECI